MVWVDWQAHTLPSASESQPTGERHGTVTVHPPTVVPACGSRGSGTSGSSAGRRLFAA
jgi:hypothetical protein